MSLPSIVLESWKNQIYLQLEVSGLALLAYHYLLTFADEIEFIWKRRLSLVTLVFAITRYLPFIDNSFAFIHDFAPNLIFSVCSLSYRVQLWSFVIGTCVAEIVLVLRTLALWKGDKRISIFLGTIVASFVAFALYNASKYLQTLTNHSLEYANIHPKLPVCSISGSTDHITTFYVLFMVFEAVILLLTLLRAKTYWTEPFKLFRTLYYDSIIFSASLLAISIINIAVAQAAPVNNVKTFVLVTLHRNSHSILTARIILDIRKAMYEDGASEAPASTALIFGESLTNPVSVQSQT